MSQFCQGGVSDNVYTARTTMWNVAKFSCGFKKQDQGNDPYYVLIKCYVYFQSLKTSTYTNNFLSIQFLEVQ